jgi:hypothetical protein
MVTSQLSRLKQDFQELQFFLRRLEKDGDFLKQEITRDKLKIIVSAINRIESPLVN